MSPSASRSRRKREISAASASPDTTSSDSSSSSESDRARLDVASLHPRSPRPARPAPAPRRLAELGRVDRRGDTGEPLADAPPPAGSARAARSAARQQRLTDGARTAARVEQHADDGRPRSESCSPSRRRAAGRLRHRHGRARVCGTSRPGAERHRGSTRGHVRARHHLAERPPAVVRPTPTSRIASRLAPGSGRGRSCSGH